MDRIRAALAGLTLFIWIASAAGCAGADTVQTPQAGREEAAGSGETAEKAVAQESQPPENRETPETPETPALWAAVSLEGGSGRASVDSPCPVYGRGEELLAVITWSSPYYDYMVIDGVKILPVNTEGNSRFEIPLGAVSEELPEECALQVQADTTAMSTPHLIDYTLSFRFYENREEAEGAIEGTKSTDQGVEEESQASVGETVLDEAPVLSGFEFIAEDHNEYAECFSIYRYEGGYSVLAVDDGRCYLIVPKGGEIPEATVKEGEDGLIILQQPLDHIYLAASAAMCQFDEIGAVQCVILSGLEKDSWYIEAAREAMESGTLQYGGKYSAPDYEKIVESGVNLAVESTMILHTPKVQEKLEKLGIPVLIDRSSYESEPLGRAEWVKVYGLLTGRDEEAAEAFDEQKGYVEALAAESAGGGKSVAIFSINSNRQVVTRTPGDYYSRMLEIAGGRIATPGVENDTATPEVENNSGANRNSTTATQTVSMEAFYAAADKADILIYNASIEDAPESLAQLCGKDGILTQFKAVSEGNVWCMRSSLYQNASRTGAIIRDLHAIVTGAAPDETEFFYRLK